MPEHTASGHFLMQPKKNSMAHFFSDNKRTRKKSTSQISINLVRSQNFRQRAKSVSIGRPEFKISHAKAKSANLNRSSYQDFEFSKIDEMQSMEEGKFTEINRSRSRDNINASTKYELIETPTR